MVKNSTVRYHTPGGYSGIQDTYCSCLQLFGFESDLAVAEQGDLLVVSHDTRDISPPHKSSSSVKETLFKALHTRDYGKG